MSTKEQTKAAVDILFALSECIRTKGSIPNGHLYAQVMGVIDIEGYNGAIGILKRAKLVSEEAHVLTWIGPVLPASSK